MKKIIFSLTLSTLLLFNGSICTFAAESISESTKITILHTNDTHGRVLSEDGGFGFGKIATLAKETKANNPNTLLLDAGDTLHGKPIINVSKGENAVKILDAAGYDFMVPGNHDFNYGSERLLELSDMADNFRVLSANVKSNGKNVFTPYEIVKMDNINVGIFGLSTPETAYKTNPTNVKGIDFNDPVEVAKQIVKELEDKTDVIIAITHIGLDDSSIITSKAIAEEVNGIDVIIDGHSHTKLENGLTVNNTLIAQTGEYDQNLGKVEIEVRDNKIVNKKATLLKSEDYKELKEDEKVKSLIDDINNKNNAVFSEVVATTDVLLDGARENVRTKETNLGNLTADAVRNSANTDIAFLNGGSLRTSIEPGEITRGKLAELFPFGNIVQIIKLSGSDVIKALEVSVGGYPEAQGGFLQVSGITFSFDPSKEVGKRVSDVKIGEKPIDINKEYTVAINDFLSQGGDGYDMFKTNVVGEIETYDDIFAKYLNVNGTKGCDVSGRISIKETNLENNNTQAEESKSSLIETIKNNEKIHVVVYGDTLTRIAATNNTTWKVLAQYNNLNNPNLIYPGDKIKIPA